MPNNVRARKRGRFSLDCGDMPRDRRATDRRLFPSYLPKEKKNRRRLIEELTRAQEYYLAYYVDMMVRVIKKVGVDKLAVVL